MLQHVGLRGTPDRYTVVFVDRPVRTGAYQLTPDGTKQLRSAGVRGGQKVPARVLTSLIRSGHAHSPRLAESAGQNQFNFSDDETSNFLPRCEMTGVTSDVHMVVYGDGANIAHLLAVAVGVEFHRNRSLL